MDNFSTILLNKGGTCVWNLAVADVAGMKIQESAHLHILGNDRIITTAIDTMHCT